MINWSRNLLFRHTRIAHAVGVVIFVVLVLLIHLPLIKPPHEHVAIDDELKLVLEPTCTENGIGCKVCADCGKDFGRETVYAYGHSLVETKKNEIPSTCTKGGSYDMVSCCETCGEEFESRTVQVELKPHTSAKAIVDNRKDSTHTDYGSYEEIVKCKVCREELSRQVKIIEPKGHNYAWEIKEDKSTGEISMVGTCNCTEEGNVVTYNTSNGMTLTVSDEYYSCCKKIYIASVTVYGKTITKTIETKRLDSHKVLLDPDDPESCVEIYDYALYDAEYGRYFDFNGALKDVLVHYDRDDNPWNEDGFAMGMFKCVECVDGDCDVCHGAWLIVVIYSAEHDSRINKD